MTSAEVPAGGESPRRATNVRDDIPALLDEIQKSLTQHSRLLEQLLERVDAWEAGKNGAETADDRVLGLASRLLELEREKAKAERIAETRLRIIEDQERSLGRYRRLHPGLLLARWTAPRIGQLYQYPPRMLHIPERYHRVAPLEDEPWISIVTPSFNQGDFIERTLQSVLGQKYPRLQYIVKDGGSTDATPAILAQYEGSLARVESSKDFGFANGINCGFGHATGDIMGYLNSDDILLPGTLHYVARYFVQHPEVDILYGHRVIIDEYDGEIGRWVLPPHDDEVLSWADYVPQETLFWRRRIWDRVGGAIDESFRFAIDWDLLIRFRDAGARMARLPRFLGGFRVHPHQKTSSEMAELGVQEMARIRQRCHGRAVTRAEIDRALRPYLRRHFVYHKLYRLGLLRY